MNKLLAFAAVAAITAVAAPAFAATDNGSFDGSIGYSNISIDRYNPSAITGRIGWHQGYFGLEGEGSFGAQSDDYTDASVTPNVKHSVKLSSEFGAFATAQAELAPNFDVFARAGYATADFKSTSKPVGGTSSSSSDSGSGFAYGAGAQWMFDGLNGVRADYSVYNLDLGSGSHSDNADVWSVSYVRKFK